MAGSLPETKNISLYLNTSYELDYVFKDDQGPVDLTDCTVLGSFYDFTGEQLYLTFNVGYTSRLEGKVRLSLTEQEVGLLGISYGFYSVKLIRPDLTSQFYLRGRFSVRFIGAGLVPEDISATIGDSILEHTSENNPHPQYLLAGQSSELLFRDSLNAIDSFSQSPNTDSITTEKEAARFLRVATMGPNLHEINDLVELGSKSQWIASQIESSFDGSQYSDWPSEEESAQAQAGWFGTIALRLKPPSNFVDTTNGNLSGDVPGDYFLHTVLNTGFISNNSSISDVVFAGKTSLYGTFKQPKKAFLARVTWVLNKLIPVSIPGVGFLSTIDAYQQIVWYNLLSRYAFKNYVDLLEAVAYNSSMSLMLTHLRNRKSDGSGRQPDENFGRELMQLFTIGLLELNLDGTEKLDDDGNTIPTYDSEDILGTARVFTGMTRWDQSPADYYDVTRESAMNSGGNLVGIVRTGFLAEQTIYQLRRPARYIKKDRVYRIYSVSGIDLVPYGAANNNVSTEFTATKDGDIFIADALVEEKTVFPIGVCPGLKQYLPWYETGEKVLPNVGITIPADTDPITNVRMLIEGLVNHPSCAPNVCKKLIQLSVTSNPSPGYVARVASVFRDNGKGVVGDMAAVWAAIFTDSETNLDINSSSFKGRVRDGYEIYSNLTRSFEATAVIAPKANNVASAKMGIWLDGVNQTGIVVGLARPYVTSMGAWPFSSPSIFGYYSLTYTITPADAWGIVVPEFGSLPANTLMTAVNNLFNIVNNNDPVDFRALGGGLDNTVSYIPTYDAIFGAEYSGTTEADIRLLIKKVDLMLCGSTLSKAKKDAIFALLSPMPVATANNKDARISALLQLVFVSPEFWVS
jgi:hypothetical protein